jgi:aminoglycoside 3-N-acetyltransferase I
MINTTILSWVTFIYLAAFVFYFIRSIRDESLWGRLATITMFIGLTAHTVPMTRSESSEIFVYDIAVRGDHQRRGIGRQLMTALLEGGAAANIYTTFVAADNDDDHALDFYRSLGGVESPVTLFTFSDPRA